MRRYRLKNTVLATLFGLIGALNAGAISAQVERSDETIAEAVGAELRHNDLVSYQRVRLTVEDGIVSLTGTVPSITASREIEEVTGTVRGVRSIINRLEVDAAPRPAMELRAAAIAALKENVATELYKLDVSATDDGAVTLEGTVDSWAEHDLAETVVGSVTGVRAIENQIIVDAAGHYRGAGEIRADILERLRWDARVDDSLISVLVRDAGRVTLSGTVGSVAEKRLATSLAQVSGVRNVDSSRLEVEPWARDEDRRLGAQSRVADDDVENAIGRALALDPRVAASDIDIAVVNGEVWLRGVAGAMSASRAAERVARNTHGARRVHNFLTVAPAQMDDSQIEMHIRDALAMIDGLPNDEIMVRVANGRARIAGDVNSAEQYRRIDEIVANTRGIDSITNDLTIGGEKPRVGTHSIMPQTTILLPGYFSEDEDALLSDRALHSAVESELFWSPFVDERDVEIEVDDGAVTLTGNVRSMSESMAAVDNAFEAGAQTVNNALEVD